MKKPKSFILIIGILIIVAFIVFAFLSGFLFKIDGKYNYDIASIILSNSLVIIIFFMTYCLLNKREIKKEKNKEEIVTEMIKRTYDNCKNQIAYLTPQLIEKYAIPKLNNDKPLRSEPLYKSIVSSVFVFNNEITEFMTNGVLSKDKYIDYITLKDLFESYLNLFITFYDAPEIYHEFEVKLNSHINNFGT